jgi:hypothetical protein
MAQNRTINFYGYAYGSTPVSLTANIDGTIVFSGVVSTVDQALPDSTVNISNAPVLFSVADSALFPTTFSGAYPMTIEVTGGNGIAVLNTYCNYMAYTKINVAADNSSINGTTLTLGNVVDGNINQVKRINSLVIGNGVAANTVVTSLSTDGVTLQIAPSQTVADTKISVLGGLKPGDNTTYLDCYDGIPSNSEGTPDSRSSVAIDGVIQVPPNPKSLGQWTWIVPTGSTISYAFNVSLGNSAT